MSGKNARYRGRRRHSHISYLLSDMRSLFRGGKRRGRGRGRIVWRRFVPFLILSAVFLYSAVSLIRWGISSVSAKRTNTELQALHESAAAAPYTEEQASEAGALQEVMALPTATPRPHLLSSYQFIGDTILPEFNELSERNGDTVGWLRIPGIVSLPVVYRDNSYYLDHDFNGKKSSGGTLFLDAAHPFAEDTQYLVIHGHSMSDGSMFGLLTHYRKQGYMDEHPTVYFTTLYRAEEYEVIGVMRVSADEQDEDRLRYTGQRRFNTLKQFESFAQSLRENVMYWKDGAEMRPEDAYLALSTCYGDDRIVVICRRTDPQ